MTTFEFYGSIAFIILFVVGFIPAIRNFLAVYRVKSDSVPRAQRIFSLLFIGTSIVCMPILVGFLVYLLVTRTHGTQ